MSLSTDIAAFIKAHKKVTTSELVERFGFSRQYIVRFLRKLVEERKVLKVGSTRGAFYTLPEYLVLFAEHKVHRRFSNDKVQEHEVMEDVFAASPAFARLPENVRSILRYTFSEMLNNAIEHSESENIEVSVFKEGSTINFIVDDFGVGVFRNVMSKHELKSEIEAVQDLLKGKTTTKPKAHSGEGIFFSSKAGDRFILESFGLRLVVDNVIDDVFVEEPKRSKKGTRVIFTVNAESKRHLSDLFRRYQSNPETLAFDRTKIMVKLFTIGTVHVSRSQARRIVTGLEKFKDIVLDFDRVPTVGQAFADEVFRVFQNGHPNIEITPVNMNEAVRFMIERVERAPRENV